MSLKRGSSPASVLVTDSSTGMVKNRISISMVSVAVPVSSSPVSAGSDCFGKVL